jgi:peptidoglycan/LPS O-acetylase OafA/YrhL
MFWIAAQLASAMPARRASHRRGSGLLRVPASLVYEYFLVHGVFFVAAARLCPGHAIAAGVVGAIPAAVLAAAGLHYLLRQGPFRRIGGYAPPWGDAQHA